MLRELIQNGGSLAYKLEPNAFSVENQPTPFSNIQGSYGVCYAIKSTRCLLKTESFYLQNKDFLKIPGHECFYYKPNIFPL